MGTPRATVGRGGHGRAWPPGSEAPGPQVWQGRGTRGPEKPVGPQELLGGPSTGLASFSLLPAGLRGL